MREKLPPSCAAAACGVESVDLEAALDSGVLGSVMLTAGSSVQLLSLDKSALSVAVALLRLRRRRAQVVISEWWFLLTWEPAPPSCTAAFDAGARSWPDSWVPL